MSKRIVFSLLGSLVASIVCTVGSFSCREPGNGKVTLVVQHPDDCFLLEPSPLAAGLSTTADMVSVNPGINNFKFDCNGRQITVSKEVKAGELSIQIDPVSR